MVATATPEMKRIRLETEQTANRKKLRLNKRTDANCQRRLFNQQKKAPQEASSRNDDSRIRRKFRHATNSIEHKVSCQKKSAKPKKASQKKDKLTDKVLKARKRQRSVNSMKKVNNRPTRAAVDQRKNACTVEIRKPVWLQKRKSGKYAFSLIIICYSGRLE